MTNEKDRILSRVQKMLALANDAAATEGERDNALRMAHATLAKHNLSMAQAELAGKRSEEERVSGGFELREYAWMRRGAYAVGVLFFCEFLVQPLPRKHAVYIFIGKESNAKTALEMTRYIINSINREASRQAVNVGETPRGNYWRSFCKGAVYRIHERCIQLQKEAEQTPADIVASTGTSLVLASVYATEQRANLAFLEEQGVKAKARISKQHRPDMLSFMAGKEYGNQISLNKQLKDH